MIHILQVFPLQQLFIVTYCRQRTRPRNSIDLVEPGKPEMQLCSAPVCSSPQRQATGNVSFHPANAVYYLSHFSHLSPSLCFSWKTTTTDLLPFVSLKLQQWWSRSDSPHVLFFWSFEMPWMELQEINCPSFTETRPFSPRLFVC